MKSCPCCSNKNYATCCGPFISGEKSPLSPEELMRSRYTAYSQNNVDYIARTMKPPASDKFDIEDMRKKPITIKWIKLEVVKADIENPTKGFVEFIAYYSHKNKTYALHELSEFHLKQGQWYYVDGDYIS